MLSVYFLSPINSYLMAGVYWLVSIAINARYYWPVSAIQAPSQPPLDIMLKHGLRGLLCGQVHRRNVSGCLAPLLTDGLRFSASGFRTWYTQLVLPGTE